MKTVLPSIVRERHQTYLVCIVVGALYLTQPENQAKKSDMECIENAFQKRLSMKYFFMRQSWIIHVSLWSGET